MSGQPAPANVVALSIQQPWATLVVLGSKSIEIRRWSSQYQGDLLIHAGRQIDRRPEGWKLVPEKFGHLTEYRGGIVGSVTMTECREYCTEATFRTDIAKHFNLPEWFDPPKLYGFVFENARVLPFQPCPGKLRFFSPPLGSSPATFDQMSG